MVRIDLPRAVIEVLYADYAWEYLRSLPLEHFMEATAQATQRKITLESLDLLHARRPEVQVFNELLVQYRLPGRKKPGQVVPDNMVVIHDEPIKADGSYDVPLQPALPFWVLLYLSKYNPRKDYLEDFERYEQELNVPYYLLFYLDRQELSLYRLKGQKYVSAKFNESDCYAIPEVDLEVGLLDGWVRYWYQGELLPLSVELQRALEEVRRQVDELRERVEYAELQLTQEREARLALEREVEQLRHQLQQKRNKS
jgi:Uma2 family endonuclease